MWLWISYAYFAVGGNQIVAVHSKDLCSKWILLIIFVVSIVAGVLVLKWHFLLPQEWVEGEVMVVGLDFRIHQMCA